MYSEDDRHVAALGQLHLLDKLQAFLPVYAARVGTRFCEILSLSVSLSDNAVSCICNVLGVQIQAASRAKEVDSDVLSHLEATFTNLQAFLEYKRSH